MPRARRGLDSTEDGRVDEIELETSRVAVSDIEGRFAEESLSCVTLREHQKDGVARFPVHRGGFSIIRQT